MKAGISIETRQAGRRKKMSEDIDVLTVRVGNIYLSTNTVSDWMPCVDPNNRLVRVVDTEDWVNRLMVRVETVDGHALGLMCAGCLVNQK